MMRFVIGGDPGPGDAELVAAARAGDRGAFARLVDRHRPGLAAVCRRLLRDPALAEDVVQEAVLQALVRIDDLREPARFGPWLRGIAVNTCRYWMRQGARDRWSLDALREADEVDDPVDPGGDPARAADRLDDVATVREALAALSPGQRAAVALCYLAGLPLARAAAVLGTEVGAVKARLHKARRALRAWLAPDLPPRPIAARRRGRSASGANRRLDAHRALSWPWGGRLRLFRMEVDTAAVAEEIIAFLRAPVGARSRLPGAAELRLVVPETASVLDAMLLDGVAERHHVVAYVRAVFGAGPRAGPAGPRGSPRSRPRRFFRLRVDLDALTDEAWAFVTDPRGARYDRPVVAELDEVAPDVVPVLEHMVVEGVTDRRRVAAFIRAATGPMLA